MPKLNAEQMRGEGNIQLRGQGIRAGAGARQFQKWRGSRFPPGQRRYTRTIEAKLEEIPRAFCPLRVDRVFFQLVRTKRITASCAYLSPIRSGLPRADFGPDRKPSESIPVDFARPTTGQPGCSAACRSASTCAKCSKRVLPVISDAGPDIAVRGRPLIMRSSLKLSSVSATVTVTATSTLIRPRPGRRRQPDWLR